MALDRFNENMDIIGGLGDDPKLDDGLSTPQFKSVFDKAGLLIQKFLNEKLIPQIENFLDEGTVLGKIAEALSGKLDKTGGTMEGPVNMSGQSLSGLNAPTADDEAATKGYVDTNKVDKANVVNNFSTTEEGFVADARALKVLNDSMPSTELLWENASPTSQFAKQTISLDLNGYNAVIIHASSCSLYVPLTALNQTSEVHSSLNYARVWNASGVWMIDFQVRDIKITRESISFGVGGYRAFYSSAPTDPTHDNTFQIPLYIYGIK